MESQALRLLLWPFSFLYGIAARARVLGYRLGLPRTRRLNRVVISVGNLTVGGTGKTPMVLWLAERLIVEGERPAILTRGYRGAEEIGGRAADEVALLRTRLGGSAQLGVGKNRYKTGQALERHGAKYFVLDDGFQHLALHRDANILLLDARDPFGGGRLLPAGRLREPVSALRRADVIVITRIEHAPAVEAVVRRYSNAQIFYAQTELEDVLRAPALKIAWPIQDRSAGRVFAFCGIGNSRAFFEDLRRWGFQVVGEQVFRDHHRYSARELEALEAAARSNKADALVCTEKDVFNLQAATFGAFPIYACRIKLMLSDPVKFWEAIRLGCQSKKR